MSQKVSEEIDLNCDAVSVDRENGDNDVNIRDSGTCLKESANEAGEGSKVESVKDEEVNLEADIGSLGEEVAFGSGEVSKMEVDGELKGNGDGECVSVEEKKPVVAEEMAVKSSSEVAEDLNVGLCRSGDPLLEGTSVQSVSIVDDTTHSGDERLNSPDLSDENSLPCGDQKESLNHRSSCGLESRDMEIDAHDDTKKKRNAENRSSVLIDGVDSNQSTSTDEDEDEDEDVKHEEPEFCVSDLVWGKVRSHPWWPGQIFDYSDASSKAKKYFKKGCYLVAYYGDQTFAWNEESRIKPFRPHFSRMEKQNNMEEFHNAVDCALDEVSRRVEFGLACSCISKEAYAEVKTEIIVNAGIREESSRRVGGDRFSTAASFDPSELVETMKALALSPLYSEVDRLQFTTSQAQLLAFHRWKGYSQLPEFLNLGGLLETDAEIPLFEEMKTEVPSSKVEKEMPENQDKIPAGSCKKEKSLSDFLAERRLSLQKVKRKLKNNAGDKLTSSSPAKKLKAVDTLHDDSASKLNKSYVSPGSGDKSLQSKQTFRVGASILRVASLLNGSTVSSPLFKHCDGKFQKSAVNNKKKGKSMSGKSPGKVSRTGASSPTEIHSQLCSAATDPLKDQGTDDITREKSTGSKVTGRSELASIKDSSCPDRIIRCLPEEQSPFDKGNETSEVSPNTQPTVQASVNTDSEPKHTVEGEILGTETEKQQIADSDESFTKDQTPTALILNFSDIDSVPSVEDLNKTFSHYGPLVSPGAEVFKKSTRAKVVFKRRADAEMAFSSSGKYSIFGPSLVSYRLKRLAVTPTKASTGSTKRIRVGETREDENTT
ncbi:Serine/threonine-protein kinase ATM [Gossypium arboreum]|uniref:Serine/threonine-protein kinase ATM n=2 Tax=Gossypium arboreum TaxID=29729 RepID=A0A0B0N3M2_GOSAR|nr:PWWP domain-containing protein 5-like [Gossypium arboreum]KAK5841542.1 hypothetical protein PVK06_003863 [Gossypium arboreum]KHG05776.1 Serine/threonine-protein kinase ATM [Gossypium arboreum]KHG07187.1 Serine/threonine-protein kinase ATM [Gossypium arboreum]